MGRKKRKKRPEEILSKEFITRTDIERLLHIGAPKAQVIFDKVQQAVADEGKLNIEGRVSWRRMYKMLGLAIPANLQQRGNYKDTA